MGGLKPIAAVAAAMLVGLMAPSFAANCPFMRGKSPFSAAIGGKKGGSGGKPVGKLAPNRKFAGPVVLLAVSIALREVLFLRLA